MVGEYQRAGLKICKAEGKFRWANGRLEKVDWLVVGSEDSHLIFWNGERIVRNPKHGEFLSAMLHQAEKDWPLTKVEGFCVVLQDSFYFAGKRWSFAKKGDTVFGTVKAVDGGMPGIRMTDNSLGK